MQFFKRNRVAVGLGSTLALVILFICTQGFGEQVEQGRVSDIAPMITKIKNDPSTGTRTELAAKLTDLVRQVHNSDQLDAHVIDDIASLLADRDDSVRYWAALALGQVGPRASRAVPALNKALKDAEIANQSHIVGPDLSSADAIHAALKRIGINQ